MAYLEVKSELEGLDELLERIEKRGVDPSPIMAAIAEDLVAAVSDQYESGGGGAWPPHAPSTLRKRRGGGQGARLLMDTGVLAASTAADSGRDFAEAFTGVDYLKFHLEGGPIIPKRNPFEVPDEVFDEAIHSILDYVVAA